MKPIILSLLMVATAAQAAPVVCNPPKQRPPERRMPTPKPPAPVPEVFVPSLGLYGDSILRTEFAAILGHFPKTEVSGAAASKATLVTLEPLIRTDRAGTIVLAVGANDAESVEADAFREHLIEVVKGIQSSGQKAVLVTPAYTKRGYPVDLTLHVLAVRDAAKATGAKLCDRYKTMTKADLSGYLDQIHPGATQARINAALIARCIKEVQ